MCIRDRNNIGIVVADCVQLINSGIVGVVHVLIALVTGSEAPAAVPVLSLIHICLLSVLYRYPKNSDPAEQ